ncbi:response regulator [Tepidibacter hydrothermalis]|uniref:Stage 0 sporulation protein A homolog n=1 Tax=Tepidibacter hydrothermalis TaxID=3036126 RepID=A0ABY8EJ36_9FIRM|nr:response regulator [Tepidibacter hydrothermalis]WFD10995.1 response regulator [Tepidibacter hydrothermalis]
MESLSMLKNVKILYVEDEPITRNQVERFLKRRVGKVILAENGNDGIEKFNEQKPDIIITDLVMPDMSGIEMMKKIRNNGSKCPCIITSALSDSKTILDTVDLKIEKYLIKPIDINALLKSLNDIVIEELESNKNVLVLDDEVILTDDKKNELELEIRNMYSKYLKRVTGKGAKLIQVLIKGKEIEILLKDNLTVIEESLLSSGCGFTTIETVRKNIYMNTKSEIENQISTLINRKIVLEKTEIYPKEKYERVIFNIK